ncbi:hypothetical protein D3C76_1510350 [compost metagenome]
MMRLVSSRVKGSSSFLVRFGSWIGSTGFFWINPSATAERMIVESFTRALRFTAGDVHLIWVIIWRSLVVDIKSMRINAR